MCGRRSGYRKGARRALARLGCYRDPVDGDWGRRSAAAHREFQKAAGLDVNGWWTNLGLLGLSTDMEQSGGTTR